jgi:hypothetical protein
MLSSKDLLNLAENLASRIPVDAAYEEERNASWVMVGEAWLRSGDSVGAARALNRLTDPAQQSKLRVAIGLWLRDNPGDEAACAALRETVEHLGHWEPWFARNEISGLVPSIHREFGEAAVRQMAANLGDPFTRGNVLVTLARFQDPITRLDTLREAENLASTGVCDGNRDFALRWVLAGYTAAGHNSDAERVSSKMSMSPQEMDGPITQAEEILTQVDRMFGEKEPCDTALERAQRILDYQVTDLKIKFLTDLAQSGNSPDQELERLISGDQFSRIEPSRPPGIHRAPPMTDDHEFARFFFSRPVSKIDADKRLLEGNHPMEEIADPSRFIECVTRLFRQFGELTQHFSMDQVDQGLWYLFGYPYSFGEFLFHGTRPPALQQECVRAMLCPFRDYYARVSPDYPGTFFYMWWEYVSDAFGHWDTEEERRVRRSEVETAMLETLQQILALPNIDCQFAALHGLNHLYPRPEAIASVTEYLNEKRDGLNSDDLKWVEACRGGKAL